MSDNLQNITKKIQKLLNLSRDKGATDHERAQALKFANSFMDKYQIDMIEAVEYEDDERGQSSVVTGAHPWKCTVYAGLAKMYGVKTYRTKGSSGKVFLTGRESHRQVLMSMGDYVVNSIEDEAMVFHGGKSEKNSFKKGAASGVWYQAERLVEEREKGNEEVQISAEKGLVLASFYKEEYGKNEDFLASMGVTLSKGAPTKVGNRSAFDDGKTFGGKISLNDQLGNSGNSARLR